jgi:serine/threonine protein kinase/WD40 repeat protein
MSEPSSGRDPVEELAEEFAARYRRGEHPSLSEYTTKYPELAEQIRLLFPALVAMEQFGSVAGPPTGPFNPRAGDPALLPEQLDDYRILREVGRGGMGVVYEAVQESLGRHVALKILPFHRLMDPTHLERFKREARAAAQLHHTNIVPVFGIGEAEGIHFYAMQFIQGQSLDAVLKEVRRLRARKSGPTADRKEPTHDLSLSIAHGLLTGKFQEEPADGSDVCHAFAAPEAVDSSATLPGAAKACHPGHPAASTASGVVWEDVHTQAELASQTEWQYCRSVAQVGVQVAEALAYAHKQRILHRDIKPSNLLLDTRGTVWIADFGLAKAEDADDLTGPGDLVGTVRFMAPERFQGQADPRSDVYSTGITLYEMLTLRPAFLDSNRARLIEQVSHQDPPPPRKLDPHIPRDLETIVQKAIAKEPTHRYATAEALADDLRRYLNGEPIRARHVTTAERLWRWCRRNPALAGLTASVVLLLLLLTGGALVKNAQLFSALKDSQEANRKFQEANREAQERLWESLRDRAQALRRSRRPGQRVESLRSIQEASQLPLPQGHSLQELRTEAIAALALPDLEVLKEWEGYPAGSVGLAFDGNLERYARLAADGTVSVRRISDDAEIFHWKEPAWSSKEPISRFSPDGHFLCIRDQSTARITVRRLDGPQPVVCHEETKAAHGWGIDFSSDSKRLAYYLTDTRIAIVDLASGQVRYLPPTGADPDDIRFAPGGDRIAVRSDHASQRPVDVQVRDAATGQVLQTLRHPMNASSAWHPDGRILATTCDDYRIRLWDVASGQLLRVLEGHRSLGIGCSFTPTGDRLLSNDWDGVLRVWELSSGRQMLSFPGYSYNILSPDNRVVAFNVSDNRKLQLLRLHPGRECQTLDIRGTIPSLGIDYHVHALHPGGRILAARAHDLSILVLADLSTGRELAALRMPGVRWVDHLEWGPSGDLFTVGRFGTLRWPLGADAAEQGRYRLGPPERPDPDSKGPEGNSAGEQTIAIPKDRRDDGRLRAVEDSPGTVRLVNPESGRELARLEAPLQTRLTPCCFTPDGKRLITVERDTQMLHIWDLQAIGKQLAEMALPWDIPPYEPNKATSAPPVQEPSPSSAAPPLQV